MNYFSKGVKAASILSVLVLLNIKLMAQTQVPVFSARFQFSGQQALDKTAIISALKAKSGDYYTTADQSNADLATARKFNKELDKKDKEINAAINALQTDAGKFAGFGGLKELRQTIAEQQKSRNKYENDFKQQLQQNTKTRGLFLVVLPNNYRYNDWDSQRFKAFAQQALKARAVKELNDVFINSVTTVVDRAEVKQNILSSVSGSMVVEESPWEKRRAASQDYIMLQYLNVSPLSPGAPQSEGNLSGSEAPLFLVNCENADDVDRLINSLKLSPADEGNLKEKIKEYILKMHNANTNATEGIKTLWNALNTNLENLNATIETARKDERLKTQQLREMFTAMAGKGNITLSDSIGFIQTKLEEKRAAITDSTRQYEAMRYYMQDEVKVTLGAGSPQDAIAQALVNTAQAMNTNYGNKAIYSEEIMVVDKKVQDGKITGRILKRGNLKNLWVNIYILGDDDYYLSMIGTLDVENQNAPPPPPENTVTNQTANTLTDQAGNTYRTVTIGDQVWMAENLNVDRFRNGDVIPEVKSFEEWKSACENEQPAWCYYDFNPSNGIKYGKIYNRYAAFDIRGLAPADWKLPDLIDRVQLKNKCGLISGRSLKSKSGWIELTDSEGKTYGKGKDLFGFNALPGGYLYDKGIKGIHFQGQGDETGFWCFSLIKDKSFTKIVLRSGDSEGILEGIYNQCEGYYIRCLRETKKLEEIKIGNQIWMTKNLNLVRFRNGDLIPIAYNQKQWQVYNQAGEPAFCFYDFNDDNYETYGVYYNWHAVNDPRGLAPIGWHIPTDDEWTKLSDYLGGSEIAGYKMKPTGYNGTNSSGFSARFSGGYGALTTGGEYFQGKGERCFMWSKSMVDSTSALVYVIFSDKGCLEKQKHDIKIGGYNVRCVKD
jgi:uncharacterized protein (TIGR02145 family)